MNIIFYVLLALAAILELRETFQQREPVSFLIHEIHIQLCFGKEELKTVVCKFMPGITYSC